MVKFLLVKAPYGAIDGERVKLFHILANDQVVVTSPVLYFPCKVHSILYDNLMEHLVGSGCVFI